MMRTGFTIITITILLLFGGCGIKPYVDVTSKEYATLQLIPKSKTLIFTDDYYAIIEDYSKGCEKEKMLGVVMTDSDTPSRIVKLPVDVPLKINVNYRIESGNSSFTDYTTFILTPEAGREYIVEYVRKEISMFETKSDYFTYMRYNGKAMDIPKERIRSFSMAQECR